MLIIKLSIATFSPEINLISAEKKKQLELAQKQSFLFKIITIKLEEVTSFLLASPVRKIFYHLLK